MKKIIAFALFIAFFNLASFAQTGRGTRPRIVKMPAVRPTPTPTPKIDETKVQTPVSSESNNSATPTPTPVVVDDGTVIEDNDVLEIKTDLITVPVSVVDNRGKFISGLLQSDFQIFEDNVQQQIEYFATVESPFTIILLIDVSPSTAFKIEEIQNSAVSFTNRLKENDKLMVVSFDRDVHVLCEPTSDRSVMKNAIMTANFGKGTGIYDAVAFSVEKLKTTEGRKAIVLFTDGVDTQSTRSNYKNSVQDAESSETTIYAIRYDTYEQNVAANGGGNKSGSNKPGGILGAIVGAIVGGGNVTIGGSNNGTSKQDYDTGRMYLEDLANGTGGRSLLAGTLVNLDSAFANIADELRQQYGVGYYPTVEGKIGQRKEVKVRINRPNLVVRSRTSYIVGDTDKPKTPK
jgi:Ca-activated chloride channel homolog